MNETASLVDDYRTRLRTASAGLPTDVRDGLLDDVEAHLAELRATSPSPDATREALARLGEPEAIAAAAERELGQELGPSRDPAGPAAVPTWTPPPRPQLRALDVTATVLLLLGAFFPPLIGWLVGVMLLWASSTWTWREKTVGTLVLPGGLALPFLVAFGGVGGQSCVQTTVSDQDGTTLAGPEMCEGGFAFAPWLGIPLVIALAVAPVVTNVWLLRRARARSEAEVAALHPPR